MSKKTLIGLLFILVAFYVGMLSLGYYMYIDLGRILVSVLLLSIFITGLRKKDFFQIIIPITIIIAMFSDIIFNTDINNGLFVIAGILVAIGFSMLFNSDKKNQKQNFKSESFKHDAKYIISEDQSEISINSSLGEYVYDIDSKNLKSANIYCNLCSLTLYLDRLELENETADFNINSSLSELKIYVPKHFKIVNNIKNSLGSIKYLDANESEYRATIRLNGSNSLAEIKIIQK